MGNVVCESAAAQSIIGLQELSVATAKCCGRLDFPYYSKIPNHALAIS